MTNTNNREGAEALNDLIQINYDRVKGYELALDEMREANNTVTSALFEQYAKDSRTNIDQLSEHVRMMGGTPADSTTLGGKVHRLWMDIKGTFAVHEKESALESCIFGDEAAVKSYEAALADTTNGFSGEVTAMLYKHVAAIKLALTANKAYEKTLEAIH